jgi:hypothetical protein
MALHPPRRHARPGCEQGFNAATSRGPQAAIVNHVVNGVTRWCDALAAASHATVNRCGSRQGMGDY